eukprot:s2999_g2.t1
MFGKFGKLWGSICTWHFARLHPLLKMHKALLGGPEIYKEGAGEDKGELARLQAFIGAIGIGDLVKSTLGPKGMDKILQPAGGGGPTSNATVTNDGATILKSVILVDISKTQDQECGDGTTSVVVLAAEMLRNAQTLVEQKMHPQVIIRGYRFALAAARAQLEALAMDNGKDPDLLRIARTTLSSKLLQHEKDHFATLAVDAVLRLGGKPNLDYIQVLKKAGGSLKDSFLEEGFILEKRIGVGHKKVLEDCKEKNSAAYHKKNSAAVGCCCGLLLEATAADAAAVPAPAAAVPQERNRSFETLQNSRLKRCSPAQLRHCSERERMLAEQSEAITMPWSFNSLMHLVERGQYQRFDDVQLDDDRPEFRTREARAETRGRSRSVPSRGKQDPNKTAIRAESTGQATKGERHPKEIGEGAPHVSSNMEEDRSRKDKRPASTAPSSSRIPAAPRHGTPLERHPPFQAAVARASQQDAGELTLQQLLQDPTVFSLEDVEETEQICMVDVPLPSNKKEMRSFIQDSNTCVSRKVKKGVELKWREIPADRLEDFQKAKAKEISSWVRESAVKLASKDVPRSRLLKMRWIYTIKHDDTAKARLVIIGYQDPDLMSLQKTSPVMTRRTRGLFLTKCAISGWTALKGDVKAAFLQGLESETEREIFAAPVEELTAALGGKPSDNVQLLKACYGLANAPAQWFRSIASTMNAPGFRSLQTEPCAWIVVDETDPNNPYVVGMACAHVDDFPFSGDDSSELWRKAVSHLYEAYKWSDWECDSYTHCGVHVVQRPDGSTSLSHADFCSNIEQIQVAKTRSDKDAVTESERQQLRGVLGGRRKPLKVVPHYSISWESDEDTTDKGWKLCPGRHFRGPGMFSPEGPCTLDSAGCVLSPNYPENYGRNQDCAIQVFNPENRSITVEKFSTEMLYDVMWVNGRMYAGKSSPHGLVPREAIQWSTDEESYPMWLVVGQQVENIGGIDEDEGKPDEDDYGYQGAWGSTAAPRPTTEAFPSGSDSQRRVTKGSVATSSSRQLSLLLPFVWVESCVYASGAGALDVKNTAPATAGATSWTTCDSGVCAGRAPELLHFLKEYHMRGREAEAIQLFQDISRHGPAGQGIGDLVSSSDIDAALMAFSEWKNQGRLGMPAVYVSETYKRTMTCFVAKKARADALELLKAPLAPRRSDHQDFDGDSLGILTFWGVIPRI